MRTLLFLCLLLIGLPGLARADDPLPPLQYYTLTPQQALHIVTAGPGKKVVFFYASWCPDCLQKLPGMMDVASVVTQEKIATFYGLALQDDIPGIDQVLGAYKTIPFAPVIIYDSDREQMRFAMADLNAKWQGGLPYTIIFDENNHILAEGNYDPSVVMSIVAKKKETDSD
jgi:thiol-disulfide isomerase/thioredoxin